jgi:hypothetical protein
MNEDRLNTTAEILDAFQGCRDAGEEIDLFEALAWRDEPPIDAFIEIVRKIKLEPVLALATQALGWVEDAEILERLKKSDELLEILSNLAKSGATDLIRWSAAKSIIAIGFDFISVSQHLTEMPGDIIEKMYTKHSQKNATGNDSISFWVYGDTLYFCSIANDRSLSESQSIFERKSIRGIDEINWLLKRSLGEIGFSDVFNITTSGQEISKGKILKSKTYGSSAIQSDEYRILLSNQIYCVSSDHVKVRKDAVEFLCELHDSGAMQLNGSGLGKAIQKIKSITTEINNIAQANIQIDINNANNNNEDWSKGWSYVDEHILAQIDRIIASEHENEVGDLNSEINIIRYSTDESRASGCGCSVCSFIVLLIAAQVSSGAFTILITVAACVLILFMLSEVMSGQARKRIEKSIEKSIKKKDYRKNELSKIRKLLQERMDSHQLLNS